jgi:hypothetical protein
MLAGTHILLLTIMIKKQLIVRDPDENHWRFINRGKWLGGRGKHTVKSSGTTEGDPCYHEGNGTNRRKSIEGKIRQDRLRTIDYERLIWYDRSTTSKVPHNTGTSQLLLIDKSQRVGHSVAAPLPAVVKTWARKMSPCNGYDIYVINPILIIVLSQVKVLCSSRVIAFYFLRVV